MCRGDAFVRPATLSGTRRSAQRMVLWSRSIPTLPNHSGRARTNTLDLFDSASGLQGENLPKRLLVLCRQILYRRARQSQVHLPRNRRPAQHL